MDVYHGTISSCAESIINNGIILKKENRKLILDRDSIQPIHIDLQNPLLKIRPLKQICITVKNLFSR